MPIPPKAPPPLVTGVTHHSVDISWEPYHQKLSAKIGQDEGRLKVEVLIRRADAAAGADWDVAYKGFDTRCSVSNLADSHDYLVRFRFGGASGWGEFSDPKPLRTGRRPFTAEDLHKCVRRQNDFELQKILDTAEASIDAPDDKGFSSLMLAALAERRSTCELLLEHGADVNWAGESGKTALMLVAYRGLMMPLELLLDNGAGIGSRDRKGMSALHYAVDGEKLEVVKLLLNRGADANAADNGGCTALIRCAMLKNNGNPSVANALIQAGARLNDCDNTGQCSLFYCVLQRHLRLAELLLANGADPFVHNDKGLTALAVAEAQESSAMRVLLEKFAMEKKTEQSDGTSGK